MEEKNSYNLGVIFNLDAKYVWHLIDFELNGPTYRSSTTYQKEKEAVKAGHDFAAKHKLTIKNSYYQ